VSEALTPSRRDGRVTLITAVMDTVVVHPGPSLYISFPFVYDQLRY
jgi:hypothetical protein